MSKNIELLVSMTEKGMSMRDLSRRSGVPYVTVCRMMAQRHVPTVDNAGKIAAVLGMEVDALFPATFTPGQQHRKETENANIGD